jgi:hypothetical protein
LDDVLKNRKSKSKQVLSFNDEFADYILFLLLLCQARQIQVNQSVATDRPIRQKHKNMFLFVERERETFQFHLFLVLKGKKHKNSANNNKRENEILQFC